MRLAELWSAAPTKSYPKMVGSDAELQGIYGFFENDSVEHGPLLVAHGEQTLRRIDEQGAPVVLVAQDTTSFAFGGEVHREGMGWLGHDQQGFFAHFALAISADGSRRPLGVAGLSVFMRARPPKRTSNNKKSNKKKVSTKERAGNADRESLRWSAMVDQTSALLRGHAIPIHIADREAESYEFLAAMQAGNHRYVARVRVTDRTVSSVEDEFKKRAKLRVIAEGCAPIAQREVRLGRRRKSVFPSQNKKHPVRDARDTRLEFAATTVRLTRPSYLSDALPPTLDVNVVHVRELDVPEGVNPVEWILFTTEAIETAQEVLRVVDYYRARWTIEEYFKAIKTGCAYEKRQLESAKALLVALALCVPIAWQMLLLRTQAREAPDAPALTVISETRLDALRTIARKPLPANPTAVQILYAIAALGGHIERNGPPGWQTLRAGLDDLIFAEEVLAAHTQRQKCDQ
jgi:hypothetical protein